MKITLSINSNEIVEIGHSDLANIVNWMGDDAQYASFFAELSDHPSGAVRCAVAGKSALPYRALKQLARDPSIEVVRNVANNEQALERFKASLFQEMLDRDVSVAAEIAENLLSVNESARAHVMLCLLEHPDPRVAEMAEGFERAQEES